MATLITGASGFIGSHLAARLLDRRDGEVRALVRAGSARRNLDALVSKGLRLVEGDLLNPQSIARCLAGVTHVYHAAGLISTRKREADRIAQTNYAATLNMWAACRAAQVQRICWVAAPLGLTGGRREPLNEDSPYTLGDPDVPYLRSKRQAELATRQEAEKGLPVVFAYPGYCLGPGDVYFSTAVAVDLFLRGWVFVYVDGGMGFVDVRDAAAGIELAMQKGQVGRSYLLSEHNLTWGDLFRRLAQLTGKRPPLMRLPRTVAAGVASALEAVWAGTPLDRASIEIMSRYFWYDSSRARRELGWRGRELEGTLRDTIAWVNSQGRPLARPS